VGVLVADLARVATPARRARARSLAFLGFRPFGTGLEIRPDNLAGGVEAVRDRLRGLGLDPETPVFRMSELGNDEARARGLWDVDALVEGYRATRSRLEKSAGRLERIPRPEAMVESFLLGGDAIRQVVLDPRLPEPILDARERRALVAALHDYDRIGRRVWSGWLAGEATQPDSCPADVQGLAVAGDVLRAAGGV
jgi:phenylacetic acid degradation operon negative regulatory protein